MLKEIYDQPQIAKNWIKQFLGNDRSSLTSIRYSFDINIKMQAFVLIIFFKEILFKYSIMMISQYSMDNTLITGRESFINKNHNNII